METLPNRKIVFNAIAAAKNPMTVSDVKRATGLRSNVVHGALWKLVDKKCLSKSHNVNGEPVYSTTGKPDEGAAVVTAGMARRSRRRTKPTDLGVEMYVRVLGKKGELIELSMAQALEVEQQLKKLRASMQ